MEYDKLHYDKLLNLGVELGRLLMTSGAEIYRAEESVTRLLTAYGLEPQVFAIPNCLIVSVTTPDGHPITRMCRIPSHGTNIELLESCNDLCRHLCQKPLPVDEAQILLNALPKNVKSFSPPYILFGYGLAASFFCVFFGGNVADWFCAAITGLAVGALGLFGQPLIGSNMFFRTVISSTLASILPFFFVQFGIGVHQESISIGVLMILVPGMALTNAMREIMAGDITSGINRTAEVILIATAIALGTAFSLLIQQGILQL